MRSRSSLAARFALAVLVPLATSPAFATDFFVDNLDDSAFGGCTVMQHDCSLRAAIGLANAHPGDDVIHLYTGTFAFSIAGANEDANLTGDLDVTDSVLVVGDGPERTVIRAYSLDRVFDLHAPGGRLTLRGVTVTGGSDAASGPQSGDGIRVVAGSLRLETCVVRGNEQFAQMLGSAIYSASTAPGDVTEIVDSWITENTGLSGGALALTATRLERSTVSGNLAIYYSPMVLIRAGSSLLIDTTIAPNTGPDGGPALMIDETASVALEGCTLTGGAGLTLFVGTTAAVTLSNNLIVGVCAASGQRTSLGGNLESPGHTCGLGAGDLDDVADPGLSALGPFGGPAPVYQPLAGSPAVDAAIAAPGCPTVDQRHLARPRDGDGSGGAVCDIGAVELAGPDEIFVDGFECGFFTAWSSATTG